MKKGGDMPTRTPYVPLRVRARAAEPKPELPVVLCVVAVGFFVGCLVGGVDPRAWVGAPHADPVAVRAALAVEIATVCAVGAGFLALPAVAMALRVAQRRRTDAMQAGSRRAGPDGTSLDELRSTRGRRAAHASPGAGGGDERVEQAIAFHSIYEGVGELVSAAVVLGLAALCAGLACAAHGAILDAELPVVATPPDGTIVVVDGTVDSLPIERGFATDVLARHFEKPTRHGFLLRDVELVGDDGRRVPLSGPKGARVSVSVGETAPEIALGERVRVTGRMHGARGDPLPRDGDPRVFAAARGVCAAVSVDSPALVARLADIDPARAVHGSVRRDLERLRGFLRVRLREALLAGVPDREIPTIRPMLVALVLGDSEEGYGMVEGAFRSVGLAHILAISGFNLAVLGWVVGTFARFATDDRRVHAVAVGVAAAGALVLMAPAASAMRSAIMAVIGATGAAAGRDWNGDAVLAGAAVILLAGDPALAGNAGFQLSFGCVLALRHLAEPLRSRWLDWLPRDERGHAPSPLVGILGELTGAAVAASLAAFLVSAPLVLLHFGTVQPMGALLTLACAPLSSATLAIAYPKAIVGLAWPPLVAWCGPLLWAPAEMQVSLVERCLELIGGSIPVGTVGPASALGLLTSIVGAIAFRRRWWRRTSGLVAVAIAIGAAWRPMHADPGGTDAAVPRVTMVAVGDGSMHLLEAGSAMALFDGGSSSAGAVGTRVLIPWLERRGRRIDLVVLSHPNLDHFSAMVDVARSVGIGEVVVHRTFLEAREWSAAVDELLVTLEGLGVPVREVEEGDSIVSGGMRWEFVWPRPGRRPRAANDCSLVARVDLSHEGTVVGRLLFTGDIETEPAALLRRSAQRDPSLLACDVMELPHHGSWREAVVGLVEAADPTVVLQSTAMRRFRSDRFADALAGRMRFATCRDGTTEIRFEPDGWIRARTFDGYRWIEAGCWRRGAKRSIPRGSRSDDERSAPDEKPITGDAVSTIVDDELEPANPRGDPRGHRNGAGRGDARAADTHAVRTHLDADGGVGGCRFENREGRREHALSVAESVDIDLDRLGTEDAEFIESEQMVEGGRADTEFGARCSKRVRRDLRFAGDKFRERVDPVGFDEDRDDIGREIRAGIAGVHPCEQIVGEEERQRAIVPDRNTPAGDDRSVACPGTRRRRGRRTSGGERDRRDAGEIDRARTGRGLLRGWDSVGRLFSGLIDRLHSLVRTVATLLRGWRRSEGVDLDLRSDRLDESDDLVAIDERDDIRVVTRLDAGAASEPQRADAIHLEGDLPDPTVVPPSDGTIEFEGTGDQLGVLDDEHPGRLGVGGFAHAREVPGAPTIEVGDDRDRTDGRPRTHGGRIGSGYRQEMPALRVDPRDGAADPGSVGDERRHHAVGLACGRGTHAGEWTARDRGTDPSDDDRDGKGASESETPGLRVATEGARSGLVTHRMLLRVGARPIAVALRIPRHTGPAVDRECRRHRVQGKRLVVVTIFAQRLSLEDRKVTLRHLEDDQRHRGPIRVALGVAPRAVWILTRDQLVANRRPPLAPSVAAGEVHGLYRVVVPVEVVGLRVGRATPRSGAREGGVPDVVETTVDRVVLVHARVEETRHARRRPRPARGADVLHVSKSAVGILARANVRDRVVDRRLRDLDAGVARGAQTHHLADRHRHVRIVRNRVVAPSAFIVLAADDQLYGAYERIAHPVVFPVHPVDLAEEERGESVSVHRTVRLVGDEEPGLRGVREDEVERLPDAVAEVPAAGDIAVGEERDGTEAGDADVLGEASLPEGSLRLLLPTEKVETPADGRLESWRDLLCGRSVLRAVLKLLLRRFRSGARQLRSVRSHWSSGLLRSWRFLGRIGGRCSGCRKRYRVRVNGRSARPPPLIG